MKNTFNRILLVAALLFQPISHAGMDEGFVAFENGDYKKAFKEFKPFAEQGYAEAQFRLGSMYQFGLGVTQDYKQAVSWYRKAAEQGNADAQFYLGIIYTNGYGVVQDYKQAASWYRKAAEKGLSEAQLSLGLLYARGQGIARDLVEAHKWLIIVVANGNADGIKYRGIVEEAMTPQQISKAQDLAREWMQKNQQN